MDVDYHSQFGQDKYLDERVFSKKRGGVFVDIGAGDGIFISNTYFFEKSRGWTGICIEARAGIFATLRRERNCICENCCVSDRVGEEDFLEISGPSNVLSGLIRSYDPRHLKRIDKECSEKNQPKRAVRVKCELLPDILLRHGISKVDYCSIDTEGGELGILRTLEGRHVDIDVFTIENNYRDMRIRRYMTLMGYRLIRDQFPEEYYQKSESRSKRFRISLTRGVSRA